MIKTTAVALFLFMWGSQSFAQCDAHYRFDGNLNDSGNNQFHGTMIGPKGATAVPRFAKGVEGQALQLDGTSAMRAYLDLSPELCKQFTISAWVRVSYRQKGSRYILSTGSGQGAGMYTNRRSIILKGSGNGLSMTNAFRDPRAWFFVAAVYDYAKGTYRLHWRDRTIEGKLEDNLRLPEDSLMGRGKK